MWEELWFRGGRRDSLHLPEILAWATEIFYCKMSTMKRVQLWLSQNCQALEAGNFHWRPVGFSHLFPMFHSRLRLGWLDLIFKSLGSRAMCAFAWELIPQAGHYAPLSDLIRWIQIRIQTRNLRKKRVCCSQCTTNMKNYGKSMEKQKSWKSDTMDGLALFIILFLTISWL